MMRTLSLVGVSIAAAFALAACGFTPMYASNDTPGHASMTNVMSAIRIHPIADHDGVQLRQMLREGLEPEGATPPLYDLDVQMRADTQELGIRKDATSSRANRIYTARFALMKGGKRVLADQVQSIVSYDIADDQYATVASVNDASDRAIRQISEEIKTRVAIYLRAHDAQLAASK